jgi:hypothetical protein
MRITFDGVTDHDGMYAGYRRLASNQKFVPPYVWTGKIRLHEVMDPPIFGFGWRAGQQATYDPKLNWHPMYASNDRNIVCGFGTRANPTHPGVSAEMRDIRPEQPYGVRTGYVQRVRHNLPYDPCDGQWHTFRWEVNSTAEYKLYWDGILVLDVIEKVPTTIDYGVPVSVGLRLDFLDVDFAENEVTQVATIHNGARYDTYMMDPVRILDTRNTQERLQARKATRLNLLGTVPDDATFAIVNVVAVNPDYDGFLTLYEGGSVPGVSTLNYQAFRDTSGLCYVPVRGGNMAAYANTNVDLVIDLLGYLK